ncbi:MAG: multidrug ABC transporter ATP-binding protein, partial [Alphaproteobacteria bacterium]|nr:multidrug ABC transporter ATP-binding protein [Alphaproteobacteria bacterium]
MLKFFENLVDPYEEYEDADTPPATTLFAFLNEYLKPLRKVLVWIVILTIIVGLIEIGLIFFAGRIVDQLATSNPADFFKDYGTEMALLAAFVLIIRPLIQTLDAALLNQSLMPNFGTL